MEKVNAADTKWFLNEKRYIDMWNWYSFGNFKKKPCRFHFISFWPNSVPVYTPTGRVCIICVWFCHSCSNVTHTLPLSGYVDRKKIIYEGCGSRIFFAALGVIVEYTSILTVHLSRRRYRVTCVVVLRAWCFVFDGVIGTVCCNQLKWDTTSSSWRNEGCCLECILASKKNLAFRNNYDIGVDKK